MGNNFVSCNCYEPNGVNQINFRNHPINNINNQNRAQDINPDQIIENLVLYIDLNQISNQENNQQVNLKNNIDNNYDHDFQINNPYQPNNQENLEKDILILKEIIDNNSNCEQISEISDSNNNNDSHNNLMNSNNSATSYNINLNGIVESRQREIVKEEEVFINGLDINNIN